MSLPSATPLWSRVEMTKFRLSSGYTIATVPTVLSPGAIEVPCIVPQHTSNAVRDICTAAVATYLNDLDVTSRTRLTGRSGLIRRQEVHRIGCALFEVTPYRFEDGEYVRLTFYICHKHKVVTNGDEIDQQKLRAELGTIIETKVL